MLTAAAAQHRSAELAVTRARVSAGFQFILDDGMVGITGLVQDAFGGVIMGATVVATSSADATLLSVAQSDDRGRFELVAPAGSALITARAEGYAHARQSVTAPVAGVRFGLTPSSAILGRVVVAGTDEPVADVTVTAASRSGFEAPLDAARSDAEGHFRFDGAPAGAYDLSVIASHWRGAPVPFDLEHGEVSELVTLEVAAASTLTATVRLDGAPCQAGSVSADGPSPAFVPTDASGSSRLEALLPGRYRLEVQCQSGASEVTELDVSGDDLAQAWDLKRGLELRGRVEGPTKPIPHVTVTASPVQPGGPFATCVTDLQGEFVCGGLSAGDYDCRVAELGVGAAPVRATLEPGSSPHVVLRGAPAASISAVIAGSAGASQPWDVVAEASGQPVRRPASTDGDAFIFERLPLGQYLVYAGARGGPASATVRLDTDGQIARINLPAPMAGAISGRVIGADGTPVPDAWVRALASEGIFAGSQPVGAPTLTDDEGRFVLSNLWQGDYDLRADTARGEGAASRVRTEGEAALIRVTEHATLSVVVNDAAGHPASDFQLAYELEGGNAIIVRGQDGNWSLPSLLPGKYTLTAWNDDGSAAGSVQLAPGTASTVALRIDANQRREAAYTASSD